MDWDCEVTYDFSEVNLGCGRRLATGLTRAFHKLGEAMVVEDDLVPRPEFFDFCTEMLERYRHDTRVHAVSGFNPLGRYAASRTHVGSLFWSPWGWATWQRAWQDYSFDLKGWRSPATQSEIKRYVANPLYFQFLAHHFNEVLEGKVDTWDFQWMYTLLKHQRFCVTAAANLVENIGFDQDATHTTSLMPYVVGLREYPLPPGPDTAPVKGPDRTHDRVYGEILMTPSKPKIALLRALTRYSATVALLRTRLADG